MVVGSANTPSRRLQAIRAHSHCLQLRSATLALTHLRADQTPRIHPPVSGVFKTRRWAAHCRSAAVVLGRQVVDHLVEQAVADGDPKQLPHLPRHALEVVHADKLH
jgi:hypothetical protein